MRYCGRDFSEEELTWLRGLIAERPELSRRELSLRFCQETHWLKPDGGLKEMSCRVAHAADDERGIFTTGIVARQKQRTIALFFTGAGMPAKISPRSWPTGKTASTHRIQMCDVLSRNFSEEFRTILANCLVHGRRNFVDLIEHFPGECNYVLETLAKVYHHEAIAVEKAMPPGERLL